MTHQPHQPAINTNNTNNSSDHLILKHFIDAEYQQTYDAMYQQTLARVNLRKQGAQPDDTSNHNTHDHNTPNHKKPPLKPPHQKMLVNGDNAKLDDKLTAKLSEFSELPDQLWIVEHQNVYTLGQAGKRSHILSQDNTPIIKTDRGGQVTWHGQGQAVLYWLFDLENLGWKVRDLVSHAEQAIEDVVNDYLPNSLYAKARQDAPGVYIYQQATDTLTDTMLGKVASLGFKIKHGFSYHGIAVNLSCDLAPFLRINPCGYAGMQMLRLADYATFTDAEVISKLVDNIRLRHAGRIALRTN